MSQKAGHKPLAVRGNLMLACTMPCLNATLPMVLMRPDVNDLPP